MKNYIISIKDEKKNDAGPKAKRDIEFFLKDTFEVFTLKYQIETGLMSRLQKVKLAYFTIPIFFKKHRDIDNIVLQYPLYSDYLIKILVKYIRKYTKAKLYFVIHDLESLRLFKDNLEYVKNELDFLNQTDGLIVHNTSMINWLKKSGCTVKMVNLEIFDYANPQDINSEWKYDGSICYAGNLAKADFLKQLSLKNQKLVLYGPNPANEYAKNTEYAGQYTPEELPKHLKQSFGLVWDGDSLDSCTGVFGEYMKYNNPHKVSLYLSSGLPVIIWKKAALAEFIESNNLGIAIDSLNDVDEILNKLSLEEYRQKKENVMKMAAKLRSGFYIKKAVDVIMRRDTVSGYGS